MMLEQGSDGLDIEPVRELNEGNYQFCYYFVNGDLGKESPEKPLISAYCGEISLIAKMDRSTTTFQESR